MKNITSLSKAQNTTGLEDLVESTRLKHETIPILLNFSKRFLEYVLISGHIYIDKIERIQGRGITENDRVKINDEKKMTSLLL